MNVNSTNSLHLNASNAYNKSASMPVSNITDQISNFDNILNQALKIPDLSNSVAISTVASNNGLMKLVSDSFNKAREKLFKSEYISNGALIGQTSLTDMVTALSEAEIALQSMVNIRDKVISAYQDIIKMQI
jgi:flagellar hook-basal body complex protein FliE